MGNAVRVLAGLVVSLSFVASAWADNEPRTGSPEKLGRVHFKTSCSPEAQKEFERALAMLHSFFFPETVRAFTAIPTTDPSCAIAYWGIAISQRPNPLVGPFDAATLKRGLDAIEKGKPSAPRLSVSGTGWLPSRSSTRTTTRSTRTRARRITRRPWNGSR